MLTSVLFSFGYQYFCLSLLGWYFLTMAIGFGLMIGLYKGFFGLTRLPIWKEWIAFWNQILQWNYYASVVFRILLETECIIAAFKSPFFAYTFEEPFGYIRVLVLAVEIIFAWLYFKSSKKQKRSSLVLWMVWMMALLVSSFLLLWFNTSFQYPLSQSSVWINLSRYGHQLLASLVLTSVWMMGICCYYLLQKKQKKFALINIKIASLVGLITSLIIGFSGGKSFQYITPNQPFKTATIEALYQSDTNVGFTILGYINPDKQFINDSVPSLIGICQKKGQISLWSAGDRNASIPGIENILNGEYNHPTKKILSVDEQIFKSQQDPLSQDHCAGYRGMKEDTQAIPYIPLPFYTFRVMYIASSYLLIFFVVIGFLAFIKRFSSKTVLQRIALFSIPIAITAYLSGWIFSQTGSDPWIVYQQLSYQQADLLFHQSGSIPFYIGLVFLVFYLLSKFRYMKRYFSRSPKRLYGAILFVFLSFSSIQSQNTPLLYQIPIEQEISSHAWVIVQKGFEKAQQSKADAILIKMNTYGGEVSFADSIRTKILNSPIPVWAYIDKNAASAGALIAIACDKIYMSEGSSIGAATVVDQSGEVMPDKYQSYMRATIRATAEAKGKIAKVTQGDTLYTYLRDPRIAEAMVDPSVKIEGIIDSGKVLTFTAQEAILYGYCDGVVASEQEIILKEWDRSDYQTQTYSPSFYDYLKGLVTSPYFQAILIMIIIGGIYFELQTPGVGFPIVASIIAGILYFAPLYIDGLAQSWEILLFLGGIILIAFEIFVIPGFGIAGIGGIIALMTGLTLALVDNIHFQETDNYHFIMTPIITVLSGLFLSLIVILWLSSKIGKRGALNKAALLTVQENEEGYIAVPLEFKLLVAREGVTATPLRPSGKIIIDSVQYDAVAQKGEFIESGIPVKVTQYASGQLYVETI